MRPDDLHEILQQLPFRPFRLVLSNNIVHEIRHRDFASVSRSLLKIGFPSSDEEDSTAGASYRGCPRPFRAVRIAAAGRCGLAVLRPGYFVTRHRKAAGIVQFPNELTPDSNIRRFTKA